MVNGEPRPGYRQENKVKPDSNVETYVALKLFIDNWRWSGVPFYLRTGKYLPLERERSAHSISPHAARAFRRAMRTEARSQRHSPCACSRTKAFLFASMEKFPARACRSARCACTSATTRNSALTRRKLTSGLLLEAHGRRRDAVHSARRSRNGVAKLSIQSERLGRQTAFEPRILRRRHVGPGCCGRSPGPKRPYLAGTNGREIVSGCARELTEIRSCFI